MAKKKRKVSTATLARLRAMRQKYGLGEFKKSSSIKKTNKKPKVVRMARRRFRAVRRYARTFNRPRTRKQKAVSEIALLGYAVVGENLFDSLTSKFGIAGLPPRMIKLGAGYMLKSKKGMLGQLGTAMYTIELYKLGKDISQGGFNLGNLFGTPTTATTTPTSNGATF